MTDKEKLEQILKHHNNSSIEDIFMCYLRCYPEDFTAMRMKDFIDSLNQKHLYPMIENFSEMRDIADEKATYLKSYLEGKMWKDEESAKRNLEPQLRNVQAIIDECEKVK